MTDLSAFDASPTRPAEPGAAGLRDASERLLASPGFVRAPRMARLLRYLVDQALAGPARPPTEYAIGLDVFDRDPARYHPGEDPIVRVQMGRLRQRLQASHAALGDPGAPRLLIPLGSYRPCLQVDRAGAAAAAALAPAKTGLRSAEFDDEVLLLQPARVLQDSGEGRAFALGLHEELLTRMVDAFGPAAIAEATLADPPGIGDEGAATARDVAGEGDREVARRPRPGLATGTRPRTLVSVLRMDAERLRATVRLVEAPLNRVHWAQHFDRAPRWTIGDQEALADAICLALRQHLAR